MKRLVEFPLADGGSLLVEIDELDTQRGTGPVSRLDDKIKQASLTFEEALSKVRPAAEGIIAKMRSLSEPPDEVSVKFGLKLSAEAGAFLAAAGAEANYEVSLTWKRKQKEN
jgi:hypothetical protein